MQNNTSPLLEMQNVTKRFSNTAALENVSLNIFPGEVHALIGENGAGKSTLLHLLSGVHQRDSGEILFGGVPVNFASPHEAKVAGVHSLYQELNLLPQLTITENIFLGSEIRHKYLPLIDWGKMHQQAGEVLKQLGVPLWPQQRIYELSAAEQQMIELAKALNAHPRLLLMDEPTSTLSRREVSALFELIRQIKAQGIGILYISHRLDEVLAIADRITVLRDGRRVITIHASESSPDQLVRLMLGRAINRRVSRQPGSRGTEVLRVEALTRRPAFEDVSFAVHAGEIVGLTGLVASGRTSVVRAIFGLDHPDSGTIYVDGQPVTIQSPSEAVSLGMGMLPEDRMEQAMLLDMSVRENISLVQLRQAGPIIDQHSEVDLVDKYVYKLRIKTPDREARARTLSGGTQQKLVLSRWLAVQPRLLIFDEPTRGIDIGAKIEIYRILGELTHQGMALLMVSSELPEIVELCDRALVMRSGHVVTTLEHDQLSEAAILHYATGDY